MAQWMKNVMYLNGKRVRYLPENVNIKDVAPEILSNNKRHNNPRDTEVDQTNIDKDAEAAYYLDAKDSKINKRKFKDIVNIQNNNLRDVISKDDENVDLSNTVVKEFDLYDIGDGGVWSNLQLQLFIKLSTPEGKTIWKDITKGEPACVSSLHPEWKGRDMNVRYEPPSEWEDKDYFISPNANLCLLVPLRDSDEDTWVIAVRDLVEDKQWKKRDGNHSDPALSKKSQHRRVIVRSSRALFRGTGSVMNIVSNGPEQYLALSAPHRSAHYAQIDLEAKADENQLVYVGSSGSLVIIVSDNTRLKRTTLHIKATNTGLAAARFRVMVSDCGLVEDTTEPIMLPSKHTRQVQMELPIEFFNNMAHCTVNLMNDEDETVAVRDVSVKKGDRCFCVWHCDCVCLSEDPKLLCREMPESRQVSAGLSTSTLRHVRSVCYSDLVAVDITVIFFGVLTILLFIGFLKALFGLMCQTIGSWGLNLFVQMPRKLDHYHESFLKDSPVQYDDDGWPVHPSTKERSVQLLSKPIEFLLNLMFFVILPCIMVNYAIKHFSSCCYGFGNVISSSKMSCKNQEHVPTHWYSRKRGVFYEWLTPQAEELTTDVLQKGLIPTNSVNKQEIIVSPHLTSDRRQNNCKVANSVDSEQDDAEYVLMQMQKSRESLVRSSFDKPKKNI